MMGKEFPRRRDERVVVKDVASELVVYDLDTDHVHYLDAQVGSVWQACDGRTPVEEIARRVGVTPGVTAGIVGELADKGLMAEVPSGLTRRQMLQRSAAVGAGALAIPAIQSIAAPLAAYAQSPCPIGGGQSQDFCDTLSDFLDGIETNTTVPCADFNDPCFGFGIYYKNEAAAYPISGTPGIGCMEDVRVSADGKFFTSQGNTQSILLGQFAQTNCGDGCEVRFLNNNARNLVITFRPNPDNPGSSCVHWTADVQSASSSSNQSTNVGPITIGIQKNRGAGSLQSDPILIQPGESDSGCFNFGSITSNDVIYFVIGNGGQVSGNTRLPDVCFNFTIDAECEDCDPIV